VQLQVRDLIHQSGTELVSNSQGLPLAKSAANWPAILTAIGHFVSF
jgi:hypothetical protein